MIRAIIFDYFGVICSDEYWKLVKVDKNMSSDFLNIANRVNLGQLSWRDFMQTVADRTGKTFDEVKSMYEQERINPQLIELIHQLKPKYKIGLITNAHHEFLEPILHSTGLDKLFDAIVISSREGYIKPDERIFHTALNQLKVKADEALFIDDLQRNVEAARELGMGAILYVEYPRLVNELKQESVC